MMKPYLFAIGIFAGSALGAHAQDQAPAQPSAPAATPAAVPATNAAAESAPGPEVLPNGDFEKPDLMHPGKPLHWEAMDGLGVQWTDAPKVAGAPPHGKAIRMDTTLSEGAMVDSYKKAGLTQWVFPEPASDPIGTTKGLSLYSDPIPVVAGKTYKVSFDFMSDQGTAGKVWCRAYANVNGQKKRVYEGIIDCNGGNGWGHFSGEFHPTKYRPNVVEFKIMLYAYYPCGVAWFDNIHIEAVNEDPE